MTMQEHNDKHQQPHPVCPICIAKVFADLGIEVSIINLTSSAPPPDSVDDGVDAARKWAQQRAGERWAHDSRN